MAALDEINALADSAPGFVWRLKGDDNNATSIQPYADLSLIVNLSVWETIESLKEYAYKGRHVEFVRRRHEWFETPKQPYLALWWIPAGHIPTILQAKARLTYLQEYGPTPCAFNFQNVFDPAE